MILTNYPLTSGSYLFVLHNNRCPCRKERPVSPYFHFISIAHQIVFGQFIQTGAVPVFSLYQTLPISHSTLQVHYVLFVLNVRTHNWYVRGRKTAARLSFFLLPPLSLPKSPLDQPPPAFIRLYTFLIHFYKTMLPQCFRCQTAGQNSIIHLVAHCHCEEHGSQSHARWQSVLHIPVSLLRQKCHFGQGHQDLLQHCAPNAEKLQHQKVLEFFCCWYTL